VTNVRKVFIVLSAIVGLGIVSWLGPVLIVAVITRIGGCYDGAEVQRVEADRFADPKLDGSRKWLERYMPKSATSIKVENSPGEFMGGAFMRFRCCVEPEAMRAFIASKKEPWQFDSTMVNDSSDYSFVAMGPPRWNGEFWRNESFPSHGDYWSYNKIFKNGGGVRCYYDVLSKSYYYESSSN